MIIAFKIILLLIIVLSFLGAVGERENKNLRDNMTAICISSMFSLIVSFIML